MKQDFIRFLVLSALVFLIGVWIEGTRPGKAVAVLTYDLLQQRLRDADDLPSPPITLVGIDWIEPQGGGEGVTPRGKLQEVIEAIARHKPAAIGVDIDLSPEDGPFLRAADLAFFDRMLELQMECHCVIALGVYRRSLETSDSWLGAAKYAPLAGFIGIPRLEESTTSDRMPLHIRYASGDVLPSLSARMTADQPAADPPWWLRWAVRVQREVDVGDAVAADFAVDFRYAELFRDYHITAREVADLANQSSRLAGKYVLLGDVGERATDDDFVIPGRLTRGREGSVASGVVVHASAVATRLNGPLYEMTHFGGWVADLLLGFLVFGVLALLRLWYASRAVAEVAVHRLDALLTVIGMAAVVVVGYHMVIAWRLIWVGFVFVIVTLFLHQFVLEKIPFGWIREKWRALVLSDSAHNSGGKES